MKNNNSNLNLDFSETQNFCIHINDKEESKFSGGYYSKSIPLNRRYVKYDDYFALIYLVYGKGGYTDYLDKTFTITPGSLMIRHPKTSHATIKQSDEQGRYVEFATALPYGFYNNLIQSKIIEKDLTFIDLDFNLELILLANNYINILHGVISNTGRALAYSKILEFLSLALSLGNAHKQFVLSDDLLAVNKAKALLADNFSHNLKMQQIATAVGMGYEKFRKVFLKETGITPNEYRIIHKLEQADALLRHTSLSLKEIAFQLGYSNESCFSRQYKLFKNNIPSEIRRKI